jgi:hypothetical protein
MLTGQGDLSRLTDLIGGDLRSDVNITGGNVDNVTMDSPTINNATLNGVDSLSLDTPLDVASGGTGVATLTGIVKGSGTSAFSAAVAGTDYLDPPAGTAILKANSGGALANATAGTDYSAGTSALATGILKSTTATGDLTIAVAGDFPTLNQNTTGSSASCTGNAATATALQTARTIGGVNFDGTANIVPQTIETANEAADTTCFPLFVTASGTQSLQPKNNTSLTFNAVTGALSASNLSGINTGDQITQDFRLTLTSGLPVTTSDVTGATTIYCTPYKGNKIALYDGANWNIRTSAEFSLALGTLSSGKPYDVFCYDNAGTPTLGSLAWTNDTTRATALARQDGVLVKSGDATRRYLGSFYTTSTTQTEDSIANRYLFNYYHRVKRLMRRLETTASWTYTTDTIRQANNSTSNQLNFLIGVQEDCVNAFVKGGLSNSSTGIAAYVSIGLDSTTAEATGVLSGAIDTALANARLATHSSYAGYPSAGRHYLSWLEWSQATGTTTWYGTNTSSNGIWGEILA